MLFLGAGASKPLGIPTMAEFTDAIVKELESQGMPHWGSAVKDTLSRVQAAGLNSDIESVLSVLQGLTNPQKALADVGAQAILFGNKFALSPENNIARIAIEKIEQAINDRCAGINHKSAISLYGELWDVLYANVVVPVAPGNLLSVGPEALLKIFTTNYDLAVETFMKSRNYGFDDGFHQDEVGDNTFDGSWVQGRVNLFKLHGSVNYFVRQDGKVTRSDATLAGADLFGRAVKERRMIYPTGEKYATRSPYYEYLGQLRQALAREQVCIIIGYSFRDTPINNAFLDGIQKNPKLRILIVGPRADRIRGSMEKDLQRNVLSLNRSFGNSTLSGSILEMFRRWPLPWPTP